MGGDDAKLGQRVEDVRVDRVVAGEQRHRVPRRVVERRRGEPVHPEAGVGEHPDTGLDVQAGHRQVHRRGCSHVSSSTVPTASE